MKTYIKYFFILDLLLIYGVHLLFVRDINFFNWSVIPKMTFFVCALLLVILVMNQDNKGKPIC